MTYKMNPEVEKILSPIKLVFENGDTEMYDDGRQLARAVFDKHYNISSYEVKDNSMLNSFWARADNRHCTTKNVNQLRQFINSQRADDIAHPSDAIIFLPGRMWFSIFLRIHNHGSKLPSWSDRITAICCVSYPFKYNILYSAVGDSEE